MRFRCRVLGHEGPEEARRLHALEQRAQRRVVALQRLRGAVRDVTQVPGPPVGAVDSPPPEAFPPEKKGWETRMSAELDGDFEL